MARLLTALLAFAFALSPAVGAAGESPPAPSLPKRPNLLLLMAEDLSPRLGAYGDRVAHTPNIDALAAEGTRFTRVFTTAGVCAPSRAGIIMGVHQNRWGAGHMRTAAGGYLAVPPPDWKAFPELLRAAGYYVVNSDKTDYQMSTRLGGAFGGPFTIWDEETASDWRGRAPDQPFFAYMTFAGTHESQVWPTWEFRSVMQLVMAPMRIANHRGWNHLTDPAAIALPPYYPDTPTVRADLARHYNNVAAMDARVGRLLAKLEEDGLADETIVVFTTDHGDGLPRAKRWLYDSGLWIPMIVRWPEEREPAVREDLVSGVDFAPTFLSLAGVPVPAYMEGRVFLGPDRQPELPYIYAARDRIDAYPDRVRGLRDRRFKYIRNEIPEQPYVLPIAFRNTMPMMRELLALHEAGALEGAPALWFRETRDREELYDTAADPHELENLAADPAHAARRETMARALDAWLESTPPDLGLLPEEELAARMWPAGEQPTTAAPVLRLDDDGRVSVRCETAGASIGIRHFRGPWRLYTGPMDFAPGTWVSAKAVRYGFAESEERGLWVPRESRTGGSR